jgi:tetratricopeptide (TPR) repeat protein
VIRAAALAGAPRPVLYPTPTHLARPLVPLQVLGHYAAMVLDPLRPRLRIGWLGAPEPAYVALGVVAVTVALAAAIALRGLVEPIPAAALALGAAALAMVSEVVPLHLQVAAADRFLYLPLAGLSVALAAGAARLHGAGRQVAAVAAALAVPAFGVATAARIADWQDPLRLWSEAAAEAAPADALPRLELANALTRVQRDEEALAIYDRLAATAPEPFRTYGQVNGGDALGRLGRIDEARARFERFVALDPTRAIAWFNLGMMDLRRFRYEDAERELRIAARLVPGYDAPRTALAMIAGVRAEAAALPPASDGEPPATAARRAALWERLGVRGRAAPLWAAVAGAPDASPDLLVRAAAYLAAEGTLADAVRAIARLREAGAPEPLLRDLDAVLASRSAAAP